MIRYVNVPHSIASVISSGLATYTELSSTLSLEDAWDLLEISSVDAYNNYAAQEAANSANRN